MRGRNVLAILICVCLVGALAYTLNNMLISSNLYNSKNSGVASSTPSHALGLRSLTMAMTASELNTSGSGVSFLAAEAGFCAYGDVAQDINLTKAKEAFRGLEYESQDYIIGSVPIPGYTETEDVHVYVHRTGWIVAYYFNTEYVAKIIMDFMTPADNKLEFAIKIICSTILVATPNISYYDFRYPDANTLLIVGNQQTGSSQSIFRIFVPSQIANNVSRFEWYLGGNGGTLGIRDQVISQTMPSYGMMNLVPSSKPDELMQPTDLKLDNLTEAWVEGTTTFNPPWLPTITTGEGGFIILLHYD